jgi:hypothetical protein
LPDVVAPWGSPWKEANAWFEAGLIQVAAKIAAQQKIQ